MEKFSHSHRRAFVVRTSHAATLALATAFLAGCDGGSSLSNPMPLEPAFGIAERIVVEGLAFPLEVPLLSPIVLVDRFPNLGGGGVALVSDGAGRFFNADKPGLVWSYAYTDHSTAVGKLFVNLSDRVEPTAEGGLLGLAFDPADRGTGPLYVSYVANDPLRSIVSRIPRSAGDPLVGDAAQEQILFERPRTESIHCGGQLAFGPDGLLYASFGDDTQFKEAQNLGVYHGKILRMTRDGAPAPGNPFLGEPGDAPFVFAYGFRNPWRFTFDRSTGEIWAGDVGENSFEEIDLVLIGRNYGWPYYEGDTEIANPDGFPFDMFEPPVFVYPHTTGKAVIGGHVYRGARYPSLYGVYLFGDYVSGSIFGLTHDGLGLVEVEELASGVASLVAFGEDDTGELYASASGQILNLEAQTASGEPVIPQLLSQTGIFADLATLEPTPGILPYDVVSPLWSDGAAKRRWIALPGLEQIQFEPSGKWTFPDRTVFVKHFEMELADSTTRRLETRVLWSDNGVWNGVTYRWSEDQSDASLLTSAATLTLEVFDDLAPGGVLAFDWAFPSPAQCLQCHNDSAGRALGVDTPQINRNFDYGAVVDNQLRAWNHIELFTTDIGPPDNPAFAAYVDPADPHGSMHDRARSYLAANCSHCHNEQTPFPAMDLRASVPQAQMNVVDVHANYDPFGLDDPRRLKTFSKENSVLWRRMETLNAFFRMPQLGSNRIDPIGLEVLGAWTDAGAPD